MLKGSCGAEREGHPLSKRIRHASRRNRRAPPRQRGKREDMRPLNLGGTTKYPRYSRPSAFCWQGWEYFFAPDGAGFHFCFPTLETALGGVFRMHRRRDAIYSAVTGAPRAISFLSWQKRYGRKDRGRRGIALSRLKKHFASACHSPMMRPVRNALRAAVQSGFPSARCAVRVALFAPVEYLTYGSR